MKGLKLSSLFGFLLFSTNFWNLFQALSTPLIKTVTKTKDIQFCQLMYIVQYCRVYVFHAAGSTEPRSPREPHIKFRVGQVIQHKKWGYRGVIVGWDPVARVRVMDLG